MVKNKSPSLSLLYEKQKVADLFYDLDSEAFKLLYSADWLKNGFSLSPHLPLFEEFPAENTKKFIENLLPEGEALKTITRSLRIASSNIYALIEVVGRDATGAFTFSSEQNILRTSFREIPPEELTERIRNRANKPICMWDNKPRLSLAGVQEKLGVTIKGGVYGLGEGEMASTHILKFSKKDQHLVLNEFFCMKLAKKTNLLVAPVELLQFEERVLQVQRFDRAWTDKEHVARIHIIDGCQALNAPPEFKYQRILNTGSEKDNYLGPINVENLSNFNKFCIVPAKAQLQLLQWILFNLLIGNTDNHGKNISYFVSKKGYEIAPAYDLVNVKVYEEFDQELSFKIGDTFILEEVKAFQFAEMAQQMNLPPRFIASHLKKICESVLKNLDEIKLNDLSSEEESFLKRLKENIKMRTEGFLKQSGLIAHRGL